MDPNNLDLDEQPDLEEESYGGGLPTSSQFVFALAIFLSAFLLFQVQLILAKFLLPWFGGSSAVWTTCMLVYQLLLLSGYWYSHVLAMRWHLRRQAGIHLALLAITGLWLVGTSFIWGSSLLPSAGWKFLARGNPIFGLLALLLLSIGLPFFLLSTTGPLLQSWYAKVNAEEGSPERLPFFLYALSNAGSLLGLLSYPPIFERWFSLHLQGTIWACTFAFFAICCASCAWRAFSNHGAAVHEIAVGNEEPTEQHPIPFARILWWLLATCGSLAMLATTNLLTQDIAPVPLLWVLPLSVYLLTFIIVFQSDRWYRREIFQPLLVVALIGARIALFRGTGMAIWSQVYVFLGALFAICMVCHGELARMRPKQGSRLTSFYLTLAVGGATGGIFVAIIAPLIFPAHWEYQIGLWMAAALLALVLVLDKTSWFYHPKPWLALALLLTFASIPKYLASKDLVEISAGVNRAYTVSLVLFALLTLWMGISRGPDWMRRREFRWNQVSVASGLFLITVMMMWKANTDDGKLLYRSRNFYGALRVQEQTAGPFKFVELLHGRIAHGLQFESNDPAERDTPTSYYNRISGAGLALSYHPRSGPLPMRVGAIGLGVGTLAAYSRPGDVYRFYDINPAVIELAQGKNGYFSFLKDTKGKIEIVRGDARLSLESELAHGGGQQYDVLLIDAFNGDSIPMHLLTVEAMEIYLKHLRGPDSLIAVHISNLAVNLEPVTAGLAEHFGMNATLISTEEKNDAMLASDWVLLTRGNALNAPVFRSAGFPLLKLRPGDFKPIAPIWTDDHSDVFSLLKKEKQP